MPVDEQGHDEDGHLNLAGRQARLNMIALLPERGFSAEQADLPEHIFSPGAERSA